LETWNFQREVKEFTNVHWTTLLFHTA
jgi:hypothetical protein